VGRWPSFHHLAVAAILVVFGGFVLVYAYVKLGIFNVAASRPHSSVVEWITHDTMINSVRRHGHPIALPENISTRQAERGFCAYEAHCVACHGAPAVAREQWANGLNPQPPYLLDANRIWRPGELDWIVRNGIKMTGMPAWRESMSDTEIREVVVFLEAMPKMQPQLYARWRQARICAS
jgi:mono/diheme cytochrome c family protein